MFNIKEIISVDVVDMKTGENIAHFDPVDNTELQIQTMSQTCERVEITPEFYEEVYSRKMILCKKCGKIMSYNSYFGCYYCTSCGYLGNAGNVSSKEVSE